jgi:hypothetical protein
VSSLQDDPFDLTSSVTDELFVVSGIYLMQYKLLTTESGPRLKCLSLKHLRNPIRNIAFYDQSLLVSDT